MNNSLCRVLGVEKPIIQGPMAWISTAPLVAAVGEAGGLGVLGTGAGVPDFIRDQIAKTRSLTDRPFAVNLGFHPRFISDEKLNTITALLKEEGVRYLHLDTLCDETHHLDPDFACRHFENFKKAGLTILTKVFTVQDALVAQEAGTDVLIVKGRDGGGHITFQGTMAAVPQVADIATVPVAASGGISDGRGMAAALMLGACGIEMGTVFLASEEADIHPDSKAAIVNAGDFATTEAGFCTGEPCRQMRNALTAKIAAAEADYPWTEAKAKVLALAANSSRRGMLEGDHANGAIMAGQSTGLIRSVRPVRDIIDAILHDCRVLLDRAPNIPLN
ncbi:nitronate monooxygenase [uncultured Mailhella sp.]|uniref:NAD(P)H-dependent flavin oxidoreductase n=1 Tax=uncultured Mailhella sp. TaxID=1981031 RepID=UPI0025F24BD3|nr:nitronate monooxygenase [uncultured Mailhella sp.]